MQSLKVGGMNKNNVVQFDKEELLQLLRDVDGSPYFDRVSDLVQTVFNMKNAGPRVGAIYKLDCLPLIDRNLARPVINFYTNFYAQVEGVDLEKKVVTMRYSTNPSEV